MRKLGTVLTASAIGGLFLALAACSSSDLGDNNKASWFGPTTLRVDVDRARSVEPAMAPRQ